MVARISAPATLLLLAASACPSEPSGERLEDLRRLPESERALAFSQLDEEEKLELFFQASRVHPPYDGLNDAFGMAGQSFLIRLRGELDERGGVPDVLSFMGVALHLKKRGVLTSTDLEDLRISGICQLAKSSAYCPELAAKLLR